MNNNHIPMKLILLESQEKNNKILLKYIDKRIKTIIENGKLFFSEITLLKSADKCNCSTNCKSKEFPHFVIATGQNFYGNVRNMISFLDNKIEATGYRPEPLDPEQSMQEEFRNLIFSGVTKHGDSLIVKDEDDDSGGNSEKDIMKKVADEQRAREERNKKLAGRKNSHGQNNGLTLNYNQRDEPRGETKIPALDRGVKRGDDDYDNFPDIQNNIRHTNMGYESNKIINTLEENIKNHGGNATDDDMVRSMFDKLQGTNDF